MTIRFHRGQSALAARAKAMAALVAAVLTTTTSAQIEPRVLVRGADVTITALDVEAAAQQYPLASRRSILSRPDQVQRLAEDLYLRRTLAEQARRAQLDAEPLIQALIRITRERILSDAQLYELGKAGWPTEAELESQARSAYDAEPQRFVTPTRTRVRHILIGREASDSDASRARAKAEQLLKELQAGAAFEQLARDHSADQATASRGGDLGFFTAGTMVPAFEAAVAKLQKPGELSPLVETQFGIHIVRFEARQPEGQRTFGEVKAELIAQARDNAHREAQNKAAEAILKAAKRDEEGIRSVAGKFAAP